MNHIQPYAGRHDNAGGRTAGGGAASSGSAPAMDYYSIMSSFQHMIISRQMEFQNSVIAWVKSRFGVKNTMVNLLVMLIVTNPSKFGTLFMTYIRRAYMKYLWTKKVAIAVWNKRPPPRKVELEVNYIHENVINHLYIALDWYLKNHAKIITDHDHTLGLIKDPIQASLTDTIKDIQVAHPKEITTDIEYRGKIIKFKKDEQDTTVYAASGEIPKKNYQILLWSTECKKDVLEAFCIHAANSYARSKVNTKWEQMMFTNAGPKWESSTMKTNKRKVATVIMAGDQNMDILEDIRHFIDTEDWHLERGINYKKSYLFYGPPGTGKTSMIKALSYEIQRHIHFLNLATVKSDDELHKLMSGIKFKETIVVLEDIDAMTDVTHERKTVKEEVEEIQGDEIDDQSSASASANEGGTGARKKKPPVPKTGLTLSGILNQLDGIHETHGMILVMTSNHPEKLDKALIRDGRVDERVLFDYATTEQVYGMFRKFYNGESPSLEVIQQKLGVIDNLAPATVENAMRHFYKDADAALQRLANPQQGQGFAPVQR